MKIKTWIHVSKYRQSIVDKHLHQLPGNQGLHNPHVKGEGVAVYNLLRVSKGSV